MSNGPEKVVSNLGTLATSLRARAVSGSTGAAHAVMDALMNMTKIRRGPSKRRHKGLHPSPLRALRGRKGGKAEANNVVTHHNVVGVRGKEKDDPVPREREKVAVAHPLLVRSLVIERAPNPPLELGPRVMAKGRGSAANVQAVRNPREKEGEDQPVDPRGA